MNWNIIKKIILTLLILYVTDVFSQTQHINNGIFESETIPNNLMQIDSCLGLCDSLQWPPQPNNCFGWYNMVKNTKGIYLHKQSPNPSVEPPWFGGSDSLFLQWPFDSTDGMIKIRLSRYNTTKSINDSNEFKRYSKTLIQSQLISPLLPDSLYLVSFRISKYPLTDFSLKNVAAYFTRDFVVEENLNTFLLKNQNTNHLIYKNDQDGNNNHNFPKNLLFKHGNYSNVGGYNWMLVCDYLIPKDSLNYISIGNFQNHLTWDDVYPTDTIPLNKLSYELHFQYYIDSVNVIGPITQGNECNCSDTHFHLILNPSSASNPLDTSKCCFEVNIESLGLSCPLYKIGYFVGEFDSNSVQYILPEIPILSGDSTAYSSICFDKSAFGNKSEITFQMIGKSEDNSDSVMCEITKESYCSCDCNEINSFRDGRFEVKLEKTISNDNCDSCCCWNIFVENNSDCHFTFQKTFLVHDYGGYNVDPVFYPNEDFWEIYPDSIETYSFNNKYNTPFFPNSKNYLGQVCVPPYEDYKYITYNIGFETAGGGICKRFWPGLFKCENDPENCCDSIDISLERMVWDFEGDDDLEDDMNDRCCFLLDISQYPTPGCAIYGVLITDTGSMDTLYYEHSNKQDIPIDFDGDEGIVFDIICNNEPYPIGGYTLHVSCTVKLLDINGSVICERLVNDSCVYEFVPPGGNFPELKHPEFEGHLDIIPNPVTDECEIYLKAEKDILVKVSFVNLLGQSLVEIYEGRTQEDISKFEFTTSNFQSGLYYIVVETNIGKITKPLMIMK